MVTAFAVAIGVTGCKGADDEYAPAVGPKTYPFEGKIDTKYVGAWQSSPPGSKLDILKDGTLKLENVTHSVAGTTVSHVAGTWLSSGNNLMFRYVVGTQEPTVLKYSTTLSKNSLVLVPAGGTAKTTYNRK
jgi:hypothetical protein